MSYIDNYETLTNHECDRFSFYSNISLGILPYTHDVTDHSIRMNRYPPQTAIIDIKCLFVSFSYVK